MFAIYKRELKSYFTSVIACLFIAVTTLISGIFFVYYNLTNGLTNMYAVYECLLILVFTVPILTMRIIADERKQKTDQLILTAPVSVGKIVFGKFLALLTIFAIPVLIMCLYPIILSSFGEMTFGMAYTNILGLFLYGMALISIGIFISSITESQVISAIISILILFLGYLMGNLTSMISTNGNIFTKILGCFDLYSPAQNFLNGEIQISGLVYYLSLTGLFLFLTCQSIQKRRWNVSKKSIGTGIFSTGFIAVALVLVVFVNLIASTITKKEAWASVDMTSQKLYSISTKTEKMLEDLDNDIVFYVLSSKSGMDETVKKTLAKYEAVSKHIKVEYKDTTLYPNFYKEFTDTAPSAGSIIVYNEKNKKSRVVDYSNIYVADSSSYYYTGQASASEYDCEGQLDSAISYVRSDKTYKIYQIEGHDEAISDSNNFGSDSTLKGVIEKYNCEVETVKLINRKSISVNECSALLLMGPEKDYTKDEAKMVIQYLNDGGKAIIGIENMSSLGVDKPNFYSILKTFNIDVKHGVVAENDASYYAPQYGPFYAFSDGTTGYAEGLSSYVFTPYTAGLKQADKNNTDVTYTALASTSESGVLKTNPTSSTTYEKEKGDVEGSFDTVVYASKSVSENDNDEKSENSGEESNVTKTSDILVFGSVYSLSDTMDAYVQGSNTQIVNNALSDFIDTDVETISVPAKSLETTQLTVTESGSRWFGILIAIIVPIAVLAGGIVVWIRRRKY